MISASSAEVAHAAITVKSTPTLSAVPALAPAGDGLACEMIVSASMKSLHRGPAAPACPGAANPHRRRGTHHGLGARAGAPPPHP